MNNANQAKVSICVPNLNTRPYLPERFESIFKQTLQDWQLIVCDGFSDDGAWEYISDLAASEPRMRISQTPRRGIYAGFNDCIRQARGEYVYIATSDDTMMPECLEEMVAALETNPDCGLCQCQLVIINERGLPWTPVEQWNHYTLGGYDQNLVAKRNKRVAPHDGLLHPTLFTIYTSITQLLIRRNVFERIGLFDGRWGSISDFEWEMRAGLVESCIYIPEKLATWRQHLNQATQEVNTSEARLKMIEMAHAAFARAQTCEGTRLGDIDINDVIYCLQRDVVELGLQRAKGRGQRINFLLGQLIKRPRPVMDHVLARFQRRRWSQYGGERHRRLRRILQKYQVPAPMFQ